MLLSKVITKHSNLLTAFQTEIIRADYINTISERGKKEVTTTNLKIIRLRLEKDHKRLTEQLEQLRASRPTDSRREGSPFGKREEEATEAAELENRMALEKRIIEQLAGIDSALDKFEQGSYGICESCGKSIDPARLEALPQATLCMSCKATQAKNAKA